MTTDFLSQGLRTTAIVVGPSGHGVVRHALSVAEAVGIPVVRRHRPPNPARFARVGHTGSNLHWHFTDRLFGVSADAAAKRFTALVDGLPSCSVVTLHDVPDPDGTAHSGRRIAAFERVVAAADAVVVSSEHEADRLHRAGIEVAADVIPLPIANTRLTPPPPAHPRHSPVVGVLGFVYPGKGHDDVIDAVGTVRSTGLAQLRVQALGTASAGHADLVAALHRRAAGIGCPFTVTGHLSDAALSAALCRVDVPVVPARAVSASASLTAWIGAGRRPLVARNGYTEEIARFGDVVTLYDPARAGGLAEAITWAAADPARTWRRAPIPAALTVAAVGEAHRRLFARLEGVTC